MTDYVVRKPDKEEEKRKDICREQLAQTRQELLMRYPFIGGVIMRMETIPVRDDRLETACTDGNNIFVDINFFSGLTSGERLFVLAHEVWHSVFLHFARKKTREAKFFNAAADLEIHFALKDEKMREPWVLPHRESWQGLSAEEIYELLLQDPLCWDFGKKNSQGGGCSWQNTGDLPQKTHPARSSALRGASKKGKEPCQESFDRHIYENEDMESTAPNDGGGEKKCTSGSRDFVMDEDYAPQIQSDTVERVRGRVVAAAQHVERLKGDLPGNVKKLLDVFLTPKLPWQELLKQFVSSCYGGKRRWLPPSRRHVWENLYLPSMRDEKIRVAVALDTSGSTTDDLSRFFAELVGLMKSFGRYEITLIQCDSQIQKVEKFSDTEPLLPDKKFEFQGFGGTDFRPVFRYLEKCREQPELLIYVTDGYGDVPLCPPPYPVMWVLTNDGQSPAGWGKSIFLN